MSEQLPLSREAKWVELVHCSGVHCRCSMLEVRAVVVGLVGVGDAECERAARQVLLRVAHRQRQCALRVHPVEHSQRLRAGRVGAARVADAHRLEAHVDVVGGQRPAAGLQELEAQLSRVELESGERQRRVVDEELGPRAASGGREAFARRAQLLGASLLPRKNLHSTFTSMWTRLIIFSYSLLIGIESPHDFLCSDN